MNRSPVCFWSSVRHGKGEGLGMTQLGVKLVLERTPPNRLSACAAAARVPPLHHKALYDAMEDGSFVITTLSMPHEILDRAGALCRDELKENVSHACMEDSFGR